MTNQPNIVSGWTQSLLRGQTPTPSDLRAHLVAVHRDNPGFTESCAARCLTPAGRNSYHLLADIVDAQLHKSILDLACGSGVLLDICSQRFSKDVALIGVDMSSDELALAAARLANGRATLHQGVAQNLDFAADASIDVVLCHWALTVMDQVPHVLNEIRRVLRPSGVFAAIVDGDPVTAPGYGDIHDLIYGVVQQAYPDYGATDLGDPRVRSTAALNALVRATFPGANVAIDPFVVSLRGRPDELAREAAGFFYATFVLQPDDRARMLDMLTNYFRGTSTAGESMFHLPINRLVVRKRDGVSRVGRAALSASPEHRPVAERADASS